MDTKQVKQIADKEVKAHEKRMHKMAGGGKAVVNKQDTRHGKMDMPFNKLNRFAGMKSGGMMKESKAMVGKEVAFMKKKGAPASMIKHEEAEMKMARGGAMRPKKDIEADQMKMAMKKGGMKYARGGSIKETMGPRSMKMDVEKGSNTNRARGEHGIQKRGHTRALEEKMSGGPKKFARGGVFDSPSLFRYTGGIGMLGEAGPEAVVPLPDGRTIPVNIDLNPMISALNEQIRIARETLDELKDTKSVQEKILMASY